MSIEEVDAAYYGSIIRQPYHIYGSVAFNELNSYKAEKLFYLLFKDSKYRLGLVAAQKDSMLISPFSAPFGSFSFIHDDVRIKALEEAVELTENWCKHKGLSTIRYTLPPPIYQESFLAKLNNVFYRADYKIENSELNFHFDLNDFTPDYIQSIWHNARKNLKIALVAGLSFVRCQSVEQQQVAYQVIAENRKMRGKPLRMSWEQVLQTITVMPADFFLVHDANNVAIGSAIVFTIATNIAQVIYWGDIVDYQQFKTMNFLSYKVFEHYQQRNFKFLDIGYSTEDSIPNYGLCEFKESLGCGIQPKLTYTKNM